MQRNLTKPVISVKKQLKKPVTINKDFATIIPHTKFCKEQISTCLMRFSIKVIKVIKY